jgi:hypothetical protein
MVTCSPVEAMTSSSRGSGSRRNLLGQADQAIGFAGHGRRNQDDVVPLRPPAGDAFCDVLDTIRRTDRRTAELLNYQCHAKSN